MPAASPPPASVAVAPPAAAPGADPSPVDRARWPSPCQLGSAALHAALQGGRLSARGLADAFEAQIQAHEPRLRAWAHRDPAAVARQAAALDALPAAARGPLHGLPVGVKDIIDSADLPTEHGTPLHAGRRPAEDAEVLRRLRAAGGLLMGKTVTTELATYAPGPTANPHHPGHSPGGSSSGSAAAVAAGMVPLAIGTQTNGSVIRPAAFCGVVGFKPTAGLIPRRGALVQSPALDQLGVFARDVAGVALLGGVLSAHEGRADAPACAPTDPLAWFKAVQAVQDEGIDAAGASGERPPLRLAVLRGALWPRLDASAQTAFEAWFGGAGLPGGVELIAIDLDALGIDQLAAVAAHRTLMEADIAASFEDEYLRGREQLSASLRGQIERGRACSALDYRRALDLATTLRARIDAWFDSQAGAVDAIVTLATLGVAPVGLASTGDPVMCTLWTFTGQPALSLPLLRGDGGLPLGVQLVGRWGGDAALLQVAARLMA